MQEQNIWQHKAQMPYMECRPVKSEENVLINGAGATPLTFTCINSPLNSDRAINTPTNAAWGCVTSADYTLLLYSQHLSGQKSSLRTIFTPFFNSLGAASLWESNLFVIAKSRVVWRISASGSFSIHREKEQSAKLQMASDPIQSPFLRASLLWCFLTHCHGRMPFLIIYANGAQMDKCVCNWKTYVSHLKIIILMSGGGFSLILFWSSSVLCECETGAGPRQL